ncbi:hypothetical protein COV93_01145, partial [Candidatus Woesearchaeota archaeon CG11_big_fil_rev_8_21_14_0_20_43_8]
EMFKGTGYKSKIDASFLTEDDLSKWYGELEKTFYYKLGKLYFRPEIHGVENIPKSGGAVLVANHSNVLPWDGLSLAMKIYESIGRTCYGMAHRLFESSDLVKTLGGVVADRDIATDLLLKDNLLMTFPGGIKDACKPFYHRYEVRPVGGFANGNYGYLRVSLAAKKPIIPIAIIGAEETHLTLAEVKDIFDPIAKFGLGKLSERYSSAALALKIWGLVKVVPLTVNWIPFPSKIHIFVGRPMEFQDQSLAVDISAEMPAEMTQVQSDQGSGQLLHMNHEVMRCLQNLIDEGLKARRGFFVWSKV